MKNKWFRVVLIVGGILVGWLWGGADPARATTCGGGADCKYWEKTCNGELVGGVCTGEWVEGCTKVVWTACSGTAWGGCMSICNGACSAAEGNCTDPSATDSCGPTNAWPACQGWCGEGTECISGAAPPCHCAAPNTCADYIGQIADPTVTRLSDTSMKVTWHKPRAGSKVTELTLTVLNADNNNSAFLNIILDPQLGSYDVLGLERGTYYRVTTKMRAASAPGWGALCASTASSFHVSSCAMTPDPAQVDVGAQTQMTSEVVSGSVTFGNTVGTGRISVSPNSDTFHPFKTNATGISEGTATLDNTVRHWESYTVGGENSTGWVNKCSDSTPVNVGCVSSAPENPTLVSPSNGAVLENLQVTLDWSAPSAWGNACPANNNRYLVYVDTFSPPTTLRATVDAATSDNLFSAAYGNTYYWKVVADNGSLTNDSAIRSFTVQETVVGVDVAWWQAVGGGVYAGSGAGGLSIRSQVPTGQYLVIPGTVGSVAALMRASGTYETGSGSLSTSAWNALTKYRGKRMDYNFFAAQIGVVPGQTNDFAGDAIDQPVYDAAKDFYYLNPVGPAASLNSAWSVLSGEKYTVFVDGDLTINQDVVVASGGYLMLIVRGNLAVATNVTNMEGIYVVSGVFATETVGGGGDVRLVVEGSVVAWDGVDLGRDLGAAGNSIPAEQFVYRPDLLQAMPKKIQVFLMQWKEVPPGTLAN